MTRKTIQKVALFLSLIISFNAQSANDKIMNYLSGPSIASTTSLSIIDQQFAGFFVSPVNMEVESSYITAKLRYEESLMPIFTAANGITDNFSFTINYTIELTDENFNTVTKTGQSLQIDYDINSDTYKDLDVIRYKGYLEGNMTITSISYWVDGVATFVYSNLPEDVYLELSCETERYYDLVVPSPWNVYPDASTSPFSLTKNELELSWDYILGAESFDVEWVFVDITGPDATLATVIQTANMSFDWRNATRINTTNNFYNISMAYPSGMLIYRVRPVGVDLANGNINIKVYGDWSDPGTTTNTNYAYGTQKNGYVHLGLTGEKNWTYNVAYAEDGKRKEGISYFDGSARSRQEVTIINTDQKAIVGETMYDYEGRPALSILPTPVTSSGVTIYENATAGEPFNDEYTKHNFDRDYNFTGNGPDDFTVITGTNATNEYYSTSSSSTSLFADFIPDALNYPFSRTIYKRDGTDRIAEQTGVGPYLMHGTSATTKYYYGTPADMEIERLFGNEVGPVAFYQKNMVQDPNGQVSIQYLDKEGRTIATSLAGTASSPLLDLDYKPAAITIQADLLSNNIYTSEASKSMHVLTLSSPNTTVNFLYDLDPISFAQCVTTTDTEDPNYPLLSFKCSYVLDIKILNEEGHDVLTTGISHTGIFDGSSPVTTPISFSHLFTSVGTYTVVKTLTIDNVEKTNYLTDFDDYITDNLETQQCVPYNPPALVDCNTSCENKCIEVFKEFLYYDATGDQDVYAYYDENGDELSWSPLGEDDLDASQQLQLDNLIDDCKDDCENTQAPDLCTFRLEAMKLQLSPGGQYFDNIKRKYQDNNNDGVLDLDGNNEPILNSVVTTTNCSTTTNNGNYNIDEWLICNISATAPNAIFGYKTGTTEYTWAEIRNLWNAAPWASSNSDWMDDFVVNHPEYCVYEYFCVNDYVLSSGGSSCTIEIEELLDYDHYMMSGHTIDEAEKNIDITGNASEYEDFLNPLGFSNNTTPTLLRDYINEVSNPGTSLDDPVSNSANFLTDPFFTTCNPIAFTDAQGNLIANAVTWMEVRLKDFLDVSISGPAVYHSIWYVMDDPAGIHNYSTYAACSTATGISQGAFDVYNNLHGNTALGITGILDNSTTSPDPLKANKFQFFRGIYKFYRDFIRYQIFKEQTDVCVPVSTWDYWNPDVTDGTTISWTSYNSTRDHDIASAGTDDFLELVWPRNMTYDLFDTLNSGMTGQMATISLTACEEDCDNNAQEWMNQLLSCTDNKFSSGELADLETDLLRICKIGCNVTPIPSTGLIGSSDGDGGTTSILATDDNTTVLYNFQDVINHYVAVNNTNNSTSYVCGVSVVYPDQVTIPSVATTECNCENIEDYVVNTLSKSWPLSTNVHTDTASIKASFNGLTSPSGTFIWDDLLRWDDYCKGEFGDIIDLPATLECIDCKCDNLAFYITSREPTYDPYSLSSGEATTIANYINNEFSTASITYSYTNTDITNMMTACGSSATTLNPYFAGLPNPFRCNTNLENVDPDADCASELNTLNLNNYLNIWQQQLATERANFENAYIAKCMEDIDTRETFTADYELNEFMYTLYYYDQAGNLIKTVPPEGVKPNATGTGAYPSFTPDAFYGQVQLHRDDPDTYVHKNVLHDMVTQYKYDSYNNLIWQSTPDGGETYFWYDKLGRLILSQNAKQEAATNYVYSYTLYDALGRIYEVGEVESTTQINDEFDDYTGAFIPWVTHPTNATRTQVTSTYYDEYLNTTVDGYFSPSGQQELRTRVASITREEIFDGDEDTYDFGTHFSYDIHGNVNVIIQENNDLDVSAPNEKFKKITYEYDLISGNVNKVNYQPGRADQYYHRYCYDADNRITKVETSRDNYIWDTDAKYFYYEHGPLARTEVGEKQVAGSDYAYTLQGWIKGVNSNTLTASLDIGKDAELVGGLNEHFATDAYGYSLGYFDGDYTATDDDFFAAVPTSSAFDVAGPSMYNGNIRHMVTNLLNNTGVGPTISPQGVAYRYDQANRIRSSNVFNGITSNSFASATDNGYYSTEHHYDLNGNITELNRYNEAGTWMDKLEYKYANNGNGYNKAGATGYNYTDGSTPTVDKNQLTQVIDTKGIVNSADFGGTGTGNYLYDEIGQLIEDGSEFIEDIKWDVYNKITEIVYNDPSNLTRPDIAFKYDPSGNRIAKILKTKNGSGNILAANNWDYYYYERDASGNTMAVYKQVITSLGGNEYKSELKLIEKDIYGSSRLGTDMLENVVTTLFDATYNTTGGTTVAGTSNYSTNQMVEMNSFNDITIEDLTTADINITITANDGDVILNIPTTYTVNSGALLVNGVGDLYLPANQTVSLQIDGDDFEATTNGKGAWFLHNSGNTLKYSASGPLSYSFPIKQGVKSYERLMGKKVYEKSNHLGNVLVTMSDRKFPAKTTTVWDYYEPAVLSFSDYYPFGSPMRNRHTVQTSSDYDANGNRVYRYGFIGQENDFEVNNVTGGSQDHSFRSYDPRLGRYKSVDPLAKTFTWNSPYAYAENRVIQGIDLEGREYSDYVINFYEGQKEPVLSVTPYNSKQLNKYGPHGPGVQYYVNYWTKDGKLEGQKRFFKARDNAYEYGLYYGSTGLFKINRNGEETDVYDYVAAPVDAVDYAAYLHDKAYDGVNAIGKKGFLYDWGTTPADLAAMKAWKKVINLGIGETDPYTGQIITKEEMEAAESGYRGFYHVAYRKRNKIAKFMYKNYKNEAGIGNPNIAGQNTWLPDNQVIVKRNYQAFLSKYMVKQSDGTYTRKQGMWINKGTDKEPDWKPIVK